MCLPKEYSACYWQLLEYQVAKYMCILIVNQGFIPLFNQ